MVNSCRFDFCLACVNLGEKKKGCVYILTYDFDLRLISLYSSHVLPLASALSYLNVPLKLLAFASG